MSNKSLSLFVMDIARNLGLNSLELDEANTCDLLINDTTLIVLKIDESNNKVILLTQLTEDSEPADKELANQIFFKHSSDSLVGENPQLAWIEDVGLTAYRCLSLSEIDAKKVSNEIAYLVDWQVHVSSSNHKKAQENIETNYYQTRV